MNNQESKPFLMSLHEKTEKKFKELDPKDLDIVSGGCSVSPVCNSSGCIQGIDDIQAC